MRTKDEMARRFDPIRVEIIKNELAAIAEEMAIAVSRTARSPLVKVGDFAASLCDGDGRLIGQGYAAPLQLAHFMEVMSSILEKWGDALHEGDVLITNDPYAGMGHLPDVAVVSPVFWKGRRVAFSVVYSHHTDAGGRFPGGMSSYSTEIYEEGLRLPTVKLYSRGTRNEALLETILANVRAPQVWLGDMDAKIAGCWRGQGEMEALLNKYGLDAFVSCCDFLIEQSNRATCEAIGSIPDGIYTHEGIFPDDGFGSPGAAVKLKVVLRVSRENVTVDFTGTDPQATGAINLPLSMTKAMVYGALKALVGPDILTNVGFTRPIQVIAPAGTIVNPRFPAAVGGRAPLGFLIFDLIFRVLAKALPDRIPVPGEGGDLIHFSGTDQENREIVALDVFFGGWGGRPTRDGIDGVAPMSYGGYGTTPAEMLERETPLVVEGSGYIPDSAGAGKHRGSLAVYRHWRFRQRGIVMLRRGRLTPSEGLNGGGSGALLDSVLIQNGEEQVLPRQTHLHLQVGPGDSIRHVVAGAGGHGDAWERDPEEVLKDVRDEKVSVAAARDRYGVVIDSKGLNIVRGETANLRNAAGHPLRPARPAEDKYDRFSEGEHG